MNHFRQSGSFGTFRALGAPMTVLLVEGPLTQTASHTCSHSFSFHLVASKGFTYERLTTATLDICLLAYPI